MPLTFEDHRRDGAGLVYVYPVLSRRAGGVSLGINLNPNNACNWRCVYCQVPNLIRGAAPPIDLSLLEEELRAFLFAIKEGQWRSECHRLVDVAFSGNGEPTSAREFPLIVALVRRLIEAVDLPEKPMLRLITNGSLVERSQVRQGLVELNAAGGEVWFKIDVIGQGMREINGAVVTTPVLLRRLRLAGALCRTWVQTCAFRLDGQIPLVDCLSSYVDVLRAAQECIAGVHLYGLARSSQQPEAPRLGRLSKEELHALGKEIHALTGLTVIVSP